MTISFQNIAQTIIIGATTRQPKHARVATAVKARSDITKSKNSTRDMSDIDNVLSDLIYPSSGFFGSDGHQFDIGRIMLLEQALSSVLDKQVSITSENYGVDISVGNQHNTMRIDRSNDKMYSLSVNNHYVETAKDLVKVLRD